MWCCFNKKSKVKWKKELEEHAEEIVDNVENKIEDIFDNVTEKIEEKADIVLDDVAETVDIILDSVGEKVNEKVDDLLNTIEVQIEEQIDSLKENDSDENEVNTNSIIGMTNAVKEIGITREDNISDLTLDMDALSEESLNYEQKEKVRPDTPVPHYSPKGSL